MADNKMETRFLFEHRILPGWLFGNTHDFVLQLIMDQEKYLMEILELCCEYAKSNPYCKAEDFGVIVGHEGTDRVMVFVIMPEPEGEPECSRVFICFDENFKNAHYVTLETREEGGAILGEWAPDENGQLAHREYGPAPEDSGEMYEKVKEICGIS